MAAATTNSRRPTAGPFPAPRGRRQELLLLGRQQRGGQVRELTLHDGAQVAAREPDAVVRDTRLREVVRADFFRAFTGADLHEARLPLLAGGALPLAFQKPRAKHRERLVAVLDLRFAVLTGDDYLVVRTGAVGDAHGGVRRVHGLATGTRGTVHVHPIVRRIELNID